MKGTLFVVACLALVSLAAAQFGPPLCVPANAPELAKNGRVVENRYNPNSGKTTVKIEFEHDTKIRPTAGCIQSFTVSRSENGKKMEEKKVTLSNPRESPLSVNFVVNPGTSQTFAASPTTSTGRVGPFIGLSGASVAAAAAGPGAISPK